MATALSVNHVSYAYHSLQQETLALLDVSFQIESGEFVSVVGPSGCGKSTLLHLIARLLPLKTGEIFINGYPLTISKEKVGYMLQQDQLLPWKTIYENVILGLKIQKIHNPDILEKVDGLLSAYGLNDFRNSYPSQLSGGMRQRAALIRTLALEPSLLLLDEPFSALDYQTRLNVSDDIGKIIRKEKKTALLVTHDISEAISMADRVIVLTKSPASIRCEIPIEFNMENRTPISSRSAPGFKNYFNRIWKELNMNG